MDTARDLAGGDPWLASLERSQARRERAGRAPAAPSRVPAPGRSRSARDPAHGLGLRTLVATVEVWSESARSRLPTLGPKGVSGIALLAAIVASNLAGGGSRASSTAAHADASRAAFVTHRSNLGAPASAAAGSTTATCPLAVTSTGYVNPLAGATVKSERIDQGVDYAGFGTLVAIGAGRVNHVATSDTGWPGAFIEYQLLSGADAGCYVFYAEGVVPADGLTVGETVAAGQPIATIIPKWPTGIELGWGSGRSTKAYAKVAGQWSPTDDADNVATPAGKNFSDLIAALGGPPGKVEG